MEDWNGVQVGGGLVGEAGGGGLIESLEILLLPPSLSCHLSQNRSRVAYSRLPPAGAASVLILNLSHSSSSSSYSSSWPASSRPAVRPELRRHGRKRVSGEEGVWRSVRD